jgi:SET domain-containing protein
MLFVKDGKAYAKQNIKRGETVISSRWIEDSENKENFYVPNGCVNLGSKDALEMEALVRSVTLINNASHIQIGKKSNTDAYISDLNNGPVTFIANKDIKEGEEITYSLHPSCFNNVKIQ